VSITTELWANPATSTTVSSGGTTAPAQGTGESWTVAGGYAGFPAASNSASPNTQFHVIDPALPTELIAVTNVSGSTWTVTRGAEGSTPVVHAAGFNVIQVVTAAGLGNLLQGPSSGNGLALPRANVNTSILSAVNTTSPLVAATMSVPAGEATAGSIYEIEAWGVYGTASSNTILTWTVAWGAVTLGSNAFTMPASVAVAAPARWRFKASASIQAGPVAGTDIRLEYVSSNSANTAASVFLFGNNSTSGLSITTSSPETFALTLTWTTASSSNGIYVYGGKAWKAA
jgi:hypothetical protein